MMGCHPELYVKKKKKKNNEFDVIYIDIEVVSNVAVVGQVLSVLVCWCN